MNTIHCIFSKRIEITGRKAFLVSRPATLRLPTQRSHVKIELLITYTAIFHSQGTTNLIGSFVLRIFYLGLKQFLRALIYAHIVQPWYIITLTKHFYFLKIDFENNVYVDGKVTCQWKWTL